MKIELVLVLEEEKTILGHLVELYEYDFSAFNNSDVNALGLYGYSYFDHYWTEKNRFPYFIKVDEKLAGFVMINSFCYVSKDNETLFLSEFFVMKKYRKQGVGKFAAKEVLNKHKGKWELTVHPNNPDSINFWLSIINECVGNNYETHENVEGVYDDAPAIAYTFKVSTQKN